MPEERASSTSWIVAASLTLLLCALQAGAMLSAAAGHRAFFAVFPACLALTLCLTLWLSRTAHGAARFIPAAITLALVLVSILISAFFFDLSWDGQWYHQPAIIHIAHDWKPLADPLRAFGGNIDPWVRHYAKGPWYGAAALYAATGRIESGKAIHLIALAAAFCAVLAASLEARLGTIRSLALATTIAANPVVLSELTTFMVDGIMASTLIAASAALFACLRRPTPPALITAIAASVACINSKFTGLVFLCFVLAAAGVWCLLRQRDTLARFASLSAATLVLGVAVFGFNPYLTNTFTRAQPFYPLLGSAHYPSLAAQNKDGNELYETPKNMAGRNRLIRFGYSIFGRPGNQPYTGGRNATLMWPLTAHRADLISYTFQESRVSAFGPLFSAAFLLAVALIVWLLFTLEPPTRLALAIATAAIVASLLINRHLWWPRYGPQLWLLTALPAAFAFARSTLRPAIPWTLTLLLLVNTGIVATIRMHWEIKASQTLRHQLQALHASGQTYDVSTRFFSEATTVRLNAAGVPFHDLHMKKISTQPELKSVVEGYPDAVHYRVATSP